MNRAIRRVASLLPLGLVAVLATGQDPVAPDKAQTDPAERIVSEMRAAERRLESVRLELETRGRFGEAVSFATSGTLHVLFGEQQLMRSSVRFEFAEGLTSSLETARTADGIITIFSSSPAFGEVFVSISKKIIADLDWAGKVLDRSDLPGMQDARAEAPLGSAMVEDLRKQFDLEVQERTARGDDAGIWLAGSRKKGMDDLSPELPLADRVELFVRSADHALLEVVHHQGDKELQRIRVSKLEVDVEIEASVFAVDGRGLTCQPVVSHTPLWTQIENTIARAEAKMQPADWDGKSALSPECLRPSKRKKK